MATPGETWTPHSECFHYTHTGISLPEGSTVEDMIVHLIREGVIATQVTHASHEDGIKTWDVQVGGLPQRLISSQPGRITIWSSRDRFGERDMTFESLVCGIRSKIGGATVQIYT